MIPDQLTIILGVFIVFVVTEGLKAFGDLIGKDLSGYATALAALVTATIVFFFNGLIGLLPAAWQTIVAQIFQLLILFLGAGGLWRTGKALSPKK